MFSRHQRRAGRLKTTPRAVLILLVAFASLLAGCGGVKTGSEQRVASSTLPLPAGASIGQTFMANYDGLESVLVYLKPTQGSQPGGNLKLYLRSSVDSSETLRTAELALSSVQTEGFYRFRFSPLPGSGGQSYYLLLKQPGSQPGDPEVQVGVAGPEAYRNGGLYLAGEARPLQLAFALAYARSDLAIGVLKEGLSWLLWLLAGTWLFLIPGWALLAAAWPDWDRLTWIEKLGLGTGCSLAIYPLLLLWTDLIGLHLGALYAWLPGLAAAFYLLWRARKSRIFRFGWSETARHPSLWPSEILPNLVLVACLGLLFGVRFWTIRSVPAPMWGDSYQHTMITQLLLDHGGLFSSWEPYIPYQSFTTHPGFSIQSALFAWLTRLDASRATLITGQIGNGLAVVALLPLSLRLSRKNRWAAIATLILAGFFLPEPAMYVNWGRYPQMGGQIILPVAIWLLWDLCDPPVEPKLTRRQGVLAAGMTGLVIAGMLLTYYRMAFFFVAFALAWLVSWALPRWRFDWPTWWENGLKLAGAAITALVLVLPWILRAQAGQLGSMVETGISTGAPWERVAGQLAGWKLIAQYIPYPILALAVVAVVWGLWRQRWEAAGLVAWYALLPAYLAGQAIRLPGANMLQNFAILIALYIPASLLVGGLIGEAAEGALIFLCRSSSRGQPPIEGRRLTGQDWLLASRLVLAAGLVGAALLGAIQTRQVAQPDTYSLVSWPDLKAMAWIKANLPPEAVFLVESWPIYDNRSAVGTDGGWWISLLAGRQNSMPPQYALLSETSNPADYSQKVVDLTVALRQAPPGTPENLARLCQMGISHVYIGQGQGRIGVGIDQLYKAEDLQDNSFFKPIYRQDQVTIFAFQRQACPNP